MEEKTNNLFQFDKEKLEDHNCVIGVDEVGRGPLAGTVNAAAVCLPAEFFNHDKTEELEHFNDSKQLNEEIREMAYEQIQNMQADGAIFYASAFATVEEIEEHNILGATIIAMERALLKLSTMIPEEWKPIHKSDPSSLPLFETVADGESSILLVDGKPIKKLQYIHEGIVKGDAHSLSIAMASIIAKVERDRVMKLEDKKYPQYGFAQNKGYGTKKHRDALQEHGMTPIHRPSFLKNILGSDSE